MSFADFIEHLPGLNDLKTGERFLLAILIWHCGGNGHCWPGIDKLTEELGGNRKTTFNLLRSLEMKGYLTRSKADRNKNIYNIASGAKKGTTGNCTSAKKGTTVFFPERCKKGDDLLKEKKEINTEKNVRTKKTSMTKEQVEKAIQAIDLEKYHKKYPDSDVDGCFEDFSDHFLCKTDLKTNKPNWMLWTDWDRAFGGWMRRPWNRDRKRIGTSGISAAKRREFGLE